MNTREISHDQWIPFLEEFTHAHRGEKIEVRILSMASGDQPQGNALPLVGIHDIDKSDDGEKIEVVAGDSDHRISHAISHPVHVRIAEDTHGKPVAMQIESDDGTSTLVKFLSSSEGEC